MEKRPELEVGLSADTFVEYYYLKEELQDFCRKVGLSTSGGNIEITKRIEHFLRTGEKISAEICGGGYTVRYERLGEINLFSKIESNIKCSEKHRAFFKRYIGSSFKFNVAFQRWLKANAGKTYQEAIDAYYDIQRRKQTERTEIDKQFEYNTYIRDFFDDNKEKTLKDAIKCWKYKKSLPGHNRYEKADLKVLEE